MARGFAVLTDNHVQQAVVDGLQHSVFVTNDEDLLAIAAAWLEAGRSFPGLVYWHEEDYAAMTTGEVLRAFEALASKLPFPCPVRFVTPSGARRERRERFKRSRPRGSGR